MLPQYFVVRPNPQLLVGIVDDESGERYYFSKNTESGTVVNLVPEQVYKMVTDNEISKHALTFLPEPYNTLSHDNA